MGVYIGDVEITGNKPEIGVATQTSLGLVKGSDSITIDSDGTARVVKRYYVHNCIVSTPNNEHVRLKFITSSSTPITTISALGDALSIYERQLFGQYYYSNSVSVMYFNIYINEPAQAYLSNGTVIDIDENTTITDRVSEV